MNGAIFMNQFTLINYDKYRTHKPGVGGSNPPLATKNLTLEQFWSQIGLTQKQNTF